MKLSNISTLTLSFASIVSGKNIRRRRDAQVDDVRCGCSTCTRNVLDTLAGNYSCGDRINWLQNVDGYSEIDACKKVAGEEFPDGICGPMCDPDKCNNAPPTPTPSKPTNVPPTVGPRSACGCEECTDTVLGTLAGDYTCSDRINWLQQAKGYSEIDACKKVAGDEFPGTCGPMCDPNKCGAAPSPVTPYPTFTSAPPSPLYCFPPDGSRVTFENVWHQYKVQVKEDATPCGPGENHFSAATVSKNGNDLTLKFQKRNGRWEGSEVRVVLQNNEQFLYGNYKFHVKSVDVMNSSGASVSNVLPKDVVLGLFTWDDTERYDVHENYNHEVDIEIARWGSESNSDVQFLMQPPGHPQMYRFFSGSTDSYSQSNQSHSFKWLPGEISWESSAGGGQRHKYTTEDAVKSGRRDFIQCLPAEMEVRMNLWNIHGAQSPDGLTDGQHIEVVIDDFVYEPAGVSFVKPGEYCSKHCQCVGSCLNGKCTQPNPTIPAPAPPSPTPAPTVCGCPGCTDAVLRREADGYSCRERIDWLKDFQGYSERDACKIIAGSEFRSICGPLCDPDRCMKEAK